MQFKLIPLFAVAILFYSCQQPAEPKIGTAYLNLPQTPYDYNTGNNYVPTLGRVLFYDTRLSASNSISCASCHKQALAFADNAQFSRGFGGQLTGRNSMPIQNLVQSGFSISSDSGIMDPGPAHLTLFWDGREALVEAQVLRPITNHIEMGMTLDELTSKLAGRTEYKSLFKDAFGTEEITEGRIAVSLASFISSINSKNSRFDQYAQGQKTLSSVEGTGMKLFFGKYNCNTCHQVMIPNGYQVGGGFVDTGLDQSPKDKGRFDVTFNPSDIGKFKIPTLRNVVLTEPYMHDGRFKTLEEVLDHYSTGILDSKNLDSRLREEDGRPKQLNITDQDKQALIAFLNTLTDYQMITDPKFASPFKIK